MLRAMRWFMCLRSSHDRRKNAPTVPSDRFCSWFAASLKIDDEQLLDSIGLDALMYLKYLKLGFQLFLTFAVIGARVCNRLFFLSETPTHR
jgi:hypothetical protein